MRAFSLLEACVSLTIFSACLLVIVGLFQRSLVYSRQVEEQATAQQLALNVLYDLKNWSWQVSSGSRNFSRLSQYQPTNVPTPEGFECSVSSQDLDRADPCQTFEAGLDAAQQRIFRSSFRQVQIKVHWHRGSSEYVLHSVVGEPPREKPTLCQIRLSGWQSSMAPDDPKTMTAEVVDQNGNRLPDVQLRWIAAPIDGVATMTAQARDGHQATFVNQARLASGAITHTGGTFRVSIRANYCGYELQNDSEPITLLK